MRKKKTNKRKNIVCTSISFRKENINALKSHPLHSDFGLSVSRIVNRLVEKMVKGEITIEHI